MLEEDVKTEDGKETTTEESSTPEDKTVPYDRFKEVNDLKKEAEDKVKTLEADKPGELTPKQQEEKQAKDYISSLVSEEVDKRESALKSKETQEEEQFSQDVQDSLDENQDIKKDDFVKFLEDQGESFTSVKAAMTVFKQIGKNVKDAKAEGREEEQAKPDMPSSDAGAAQEVEVPAEDKGRSFTQVTQDIIRGLAKKS